MPGLLQPLSDDFPRHRGHGAVICRRCALKGRAFFRFEPNANRAFFCHGQYVAQWETTSNKVVDCAGRQAQYAGHSAVARKSRGTALDPGGPRHGTQAHDHRPTVRRAERWWRLLYRVEHRHREPGLCRSGYGYGLVPLGSDGRPWRVQPGRVVVSVGCAAAPGAQAGGATSPILGRGGVQTAAAGGSPAQNARRHPRGGTGGGPPWPGPVEPAAAPSMTSPASLTPTPRKGFPSPARRSCRRSGTTGCSSPSPSSSPAGRHSG